MTNLKVNTHMEFLDNLLMFVIEHGGIRGYSAIEVVSHFKAIRSAISKYFRLREKVGKLGKRANELYESHHRSAPFSLTKFIMEIRDFKLDGEGEK